MRSWIPIVGLMVLATAWFGGRGAQAATPPSTALTVHLTAGPSLRGGAKGPFYIRVEAPGRPPAATVLRDESGLNAALVRDAAGNPKCSKEKIRRTGLVAPQAGPTTVPSWCLVLTSLSPGSVVDGTLTGENAQVSLKVAVRDSFVGWPLVVATLGWALAIGAALGTSALRRLIRSELLPAVLRRNQLDNPDRIVGLQAWVDGQRAAGRAAPRLLPVVQHLIDEGPISVRLARSHLRQALDDSQLPADYQISIEASQEASSQVYQFTALATPDGQLLAQLPAARLAALLGEAGQQYQALVDARKAVAALPNEATRRALTARVDQLLGHLQARSAEQGLDDIATDLQELADALDTEQLAQPPAPAAAKPAGPGAPLMKVAVAADQGQGPSSSTGRPAWLRWPWVLVVPGVALVAVVVAFLATTTPGVRSTAPGAQAGASQPAGESLPFTEAGSSSVKAGAAAQALGGAPTPSHSIRWMIFGIAGVGLIVALIMLARLVPIRRWGYAPAIALTGVGALLVIGIGVLTVAVGTYAPNPAFGTGGDYLALIESSFGSGAVSGLLGMLAYWKATDNAPAG